MSAGATALKSGLRAGAKLFGILLVITLVKAIVHVVAGHAPTPTWIDFWLKNLIFSIFISVVAVLVIWAYRAIRPE